MKFAIIKTGGKQYKISPDESIKIEKLSANLKEGDEVVFDKVLLINDEKETVVGTPYIEGAKITAIYETRGRNKKISVIRFKSKSRYFKKKGHRQIHDKVKIGTIK
ncbi:50S ribosomal protein L21 [Patescibacteria group bacterium]|nr:50S ribosomal protein L21 [Patescibacteria group bacterium]MBU1246444.1 50S ribosomal protein L21 [Patescibacteria group bacterium]MBU1519666.1 50S ribosomal protein L21 [Patescibacteria group bacterium]MBU1730203.1 50S ribosomal protein L21 [Patescibacteria group bacterium]MBU1956618.1 50S ribosomal protein L21 [Patescibacteria group bacterium]